MTYRWTDHATVISVAISGIALNSTALVICESLCYHHVARFTTRWSHSVCFSHLLKQLTYMNSMTNVLLRFWNHLVVMWFDCPNTDCSMYPDHPHVCLLSYHLSVTSDFSAQICVNSASICTAHTAQCISLFCALCCILTSAVCDVVTVGGQMHVCHLWRWLTFMWKVCGFFTFVVT